MKTITTKEITTSGYYWYKCLGIVNFWEISYIFKDYVDGPWRIRTFCGTFDLNDFTGKELNQKYEWITADRPR